MDLKFTVITVVYNGEKTIKKTIQSILDQSYLPFEYIVIDGKSTDQTIRILKEKQSCFLEKGIQITIISEKDSGIYNAMNKGIKIAQGDFISFLNCGDWYEEDALQNINELYNESPFDLTYGGLHYINPNGTITIKKSKLDNFPISSRHWNHPSMFLRNKIYKKYGFDEKYKAYADFNLYLSLRKDMNIKINVIDKVITNFVADGVSTDTSLKKVISRSKEKYEAYRKNGYGRIYWIESYGWELFKLVYFKIKG